VVRRRKISRSLTKSPTVPAGKAARRIAEQEELRLLYLGFTCARDLVDSGFYSEEAVLEVENAREDGSSVRVAYAALNRESQHAVGSRRETRARSPA
jgi:hypothetical protein